MFWFISFHLWVVILFIVFCLELSRQSWVRTRTWLSNWPAHKCRLINVPIWESDTISDCLNSPSLWSFSKYFFSSPQKASKRSQFLHPLTMTIVPQHSLFETSLQLAPFQLPLSMKGIMLWSGGNVKIGLLDYFLSPCRNSLKQCPELTGAGNSEGPEHFTQCCKFASTSFWPDQVDRIVDIMFQVPCRQAMHSQCDL